MLCYDDWGYCHDDMGDQRIGGDTIFRVSMEMEGCGDVKEFIVYL